MTTGTVLVLGARLDQLPVFAAARRRQFSIATIDPKPDAPGMGLADHRLVSDLGDQTACLDFASRLDIVGVLTFAADYPVPMAAFLARSLDLAGVSEQTAALATDKLLMREAFADAGVPSPRWVHVRSGSEAVVAARTLGTDVVVKPRRSSGSRGVQAVAAGRDRDLEYAVQAATAFDDCGGVLVEELVDGPEVSVESICVSGQPTIIARTDKLTSGAPDFVEVGHSQPACLTSGVEKELDSATCAAIAAIHMVDGVSHAEFRLTPDGPVAMEIAARAGGGAIAADLTRLSTGIDLADHAVALAVGERPDCHQTEQRAAATVYLAPPCGTVSAIGGIDEAMGIPGVERIDLWTEVGDIIEPLRDATQRVGRVIAYGKDRSSAAAAGAAAAAAISIEVSQ